jgi:hypothetical protein
MVASKPATRESGIGFDLTNPRAILVTHQEEEIVVPPPGSVVSADAFGVLSRSFEGDAILD